MVSLGKQYRALCSGAIYEVVETDQKGGVILQHTVKGFTVKFPEAQLPKLFEEVA
jgi:hypothetical protein